MYKHIESMIQLKLLSFKSLVICCQHKSIKIKILCCNMYLHGNLFNKGTAMLLTKG